jgi:hypothetical protein
MGFSVAQKLSIIGAGPTLAQFVSRIRDAINISFDSMARLHILDDPGLFFVMLLQLADLLILSPPQPAEEADREGHQAA